MTNYARWNTILGWGVFLVASMVYLLTLESTVSLWDCGEYITAAYKLEVGHPPGAPLFMVLGRLFSFFAAPENVAVWINRLSAFSSSFTILFMFWSLTLFVKKMILSKKSELSSSHFSIAQKTTAVNNEAIAYTSPSTAENQKESENVPDVPPPVIPVPAVTPVMSPTWAVTQVKSKSVADVFDST